MKAALLALFNAPSRLLTRIDADLDKSLNPPCDFVGMCRCGERLRTDLEKSVGECCDCHSRWW